jgi:hypothetical protein
MILDNYLSTQSACLKSAINLVAATQSMSEAIARLEAAIARLDAAR